MGIPALAEQLSETEFNARLRSLMRAQGLKAIHVREADEPGVLDLVVYQSEALYGWLELKVDNEAVRTSQKEFLRDHRNSYVLRYMSRSGNILVYRRNAETPMATVKIGIDWKTSLMKWNEYG